MTSSEIDFLKQHINDKFQSAEETRKEILSDIESIRRAIPQIAREKAEETIAKTAFIKPFEKWSLIIAIIGMLIMAFASYGKLNSMMDRFMILEKRIYEERVLENSEWINENKQGFQNHITSLKKRLEEQNLQIQLIKNNLERISNSDRFYVK